MLEGGNLEIRLSPGLVTRRRGEETLLCRSTTSISVSLLASKAEEKKLLTDIVQRSWKKNWFVECLIVSKKGPTATV
jgi:hypothetical protein